VILEEIDTGRSRAFIQAITFAIDVNTLFGETIEKAKASSTYAFLLPDSHPIKGQ